MNSRVILWLVDVIGCGRGGRRLFQRQVTCNHFKPDSSTRKNYSLHNIVTPQKIVAIEGNIGSGKTSCLNFFNKQKNVDIHKEPLSHWRNIGDTNALKLLYESPERWSFLFNQYAMLGRLKIQLEPSVALVKVIERSIYSTHHVFVMNNYKQKHLTDLEFAVIESWFNFFSTSPAFPPVSHFIYLRTDPVLCLERINKRKRPEEQKISLEFLKGLHQLHEDLFIDNPSKLPGCVHVVDASRDLLQMETEMENLFCKISS